MSKQLECRIVIEQGPYDFTIGMYDPLNSRYEPLGTHPNSKRDKIIYDLKVSIERAGHKLTFCEKSRK